MICLQDSECVRDRMMREGRRRKDHNPRSRDDIGAEMPRSSHSGRKPGVACTGRTAFAIWTPLEQMAYDDADDDDDDEEEDEEEEEEEEEEGERGGVEEEEKEEEEKKKNKKKKTTMMKK